jgi:hypothetical protein
MVFFKECPFCFYRQSSVENTVFCQNFVFRVFKEGFGLFTPTRFLCKANFYFYIILNIKKKNVLEVN